MKQTIKIQLVIASIFITCSSIAQVTEQWVTPYGGTEIDGAVDIAIDGSGNTYVAGTSYINGSFDIVTVKYDNNGVELWADTINGTGNGLDEARRIAVDNAGDPIVTGYIFMGGTNWDIVTRKFDANTGLPQWTATYNHNGGFEEPYDMAIDAANNIFIVGSRTQSGTNSDFVTLRYLPSGGAPIIAAQNGNGNSIDQALAVDLDVAGNVFVTGRSYFNTPRDFDYATIKYTNVLVVDNTWNGGNLVYYDGTGVDTDYPTDIVAGANGNIYVTGTSEGTLIEENDFATVKYSSTGTQTWVRRYNGKDDNNDQPNALIVDGNQNVYVTGRAFGNGTGEDYITIRYNTAGDTVWTKVYNGPPGNGIDQANDMRLNATEDFLYITGISKGDTTGNDYLTLKYDTTASNTPVWVARYDGTAQNADVALAMEIDGQENIYVTGKSKRTGQKEDFITIKYCQILADAGIDTSICFGDTVQLNASSGGTNYAWSPTTGLSNPNIQNPLAFPGIDITYTVTITNANGCTDTDQVTVTVNPLPGPNISTSGPTEFCLGDSVILFTEDSLNPYYWSTGDTSMPTTVFVTGTYTLTITDSTGCENFTSIDITSFALPLVDAGTGDSICVGNSTQLLASGAESYLWTPGNSLNDDTLIDPTATPPLDTLYYYVTGTDTNQCVNTDSVLVLVYPLPQKPTIIYGGGVLTCTVTASSYQWYHNSVLINGAVNQTHTPQYNGHYIVHIVDSNGCENTSEINFVQDIPDGISEVSVVNNISIYPNPNSGLFNLEFNIAGKEKVGLEMINNLGQIVYRKNLGEISGNFQSNVLTNNLTSGIYHLKISAGATSLNEKIIIH